MPTKRAKSNYGSILGAILVGTPLALLTWSQAAVYADADTLWRATLALNPACWTAHEHLAASLAQRGQTAEAIAEYEAGLAINPDSVDALTNLGQLELDADPPRYDRAAAHLQHAIAVNPLAAAAHSNLGLVWMRTGRLEDAVAEQRTALRIRPEFGDVRCHLTVALEGLRQVGAAATEGAECRRLEPEMAERIASVHESQASALAGAGRFPAAVAELEQAVRIMPDSWRAHRALAVVHEALGRHDAAIAEFRAAASFSAGDIKAEILNDCGALLTAVGRHAEAVASLSEAVRLRPDFANARANLDRAQTALQADK